MIITILKERKSSTLNVRTRFKYFIIIIFRQLCVLQTTDVCFQNSRDTIIVARRIMPLYLVLMDALTAWLYCFPLPALRFSAVMQALQTHVHQPLIVSEILKPGCCSVVARNL